MSCSATCRLRMGTRRTSTSRGPSPMRPKRAMGLMPCDLKWNVAGHVLAAVDLHRPLSSEMLPGPYSTTPKRENVSDTFLTARLRQEEGLPEETVERYRLSRDSRLAMRPTAGDSVTPAPQRVPRHVPAAMPLTGTCASNILVINSPRLRRKGARNAEGN